MTAPAFTLAAIAKLGLCKERMDFARKVLPARRKITAARAREAGMLLDDIVDVASAVAKTNKDVDRRLRFWASDCAAHVLHIYEKTEPGGAPRDAIIATRQYARGEIHKAARSAAGDAAGDAAWSAARSAAGDAAWSAARSAAYGAARSAAWAAWVAEDAVGAERNAEKKWQYDRLVEWLSDEEPDDWPLPVRESEAACKGDTP